MFPSFRSPVSKSLSSMDGVGVLPAGVRANLMVVMFWSGMISCVGCDELPSVPGLDQQAVAPATSAPTQENSGSTTNTVINESQAVTPAAPIKPAPAEVVAEFLEKLSPERTDQDLATLASLDSGTDQITVLDLSRNIGVTDAGLRHVGALKNVRTVNLSHTRVTAAGLQHVSQVPEIEVLNLFGVPIDTAAIEQLKPLRQLKQLILGETQIDDRVFGFLREHEQLEVLDITSTRIRGEDFGHLQELPRLRVLMAWQTQVNDEALRLWKGSKTLEVLNLGMTEITDRGVQLLKSFPNLKELHIGHCQVTDAGVVTLSALRDLEVLVLSYDRIVTDKGLAKLRGLKKLKKLMVDETRCSSLEVLQKEFPKVEIVR